MATGYGETNAFVHYYGHPSSGTGPVTTAADMGRLMTALLSDDPRLGSGVAEAMKTQQFTQDPRGTQPRPISGDTRIYAGTYTSTQSRGDLLRFAVLFDHVTVTATGDGELTTVGLSRAGTKQRWHQVAAGLFAERGGQELIAFDDRGLLAGGHREEATTFERSPVTLHLWLLYVGLVAFLAALVGMPVAALVRRLRGRSARHRLAWWLAWLTSGLVAVFVYGLAATIVIAPTDAVLVGSPLLIGALLASSTAFVLTAGLVVCTTVAWWKGWWGLRGRISFTAYTAAGVAFMTIAYLYNMVGGVFA